MRKLHGSGACSTRNPFQRYLLYMLICSYFCIFLLHYMSKTVILTPQKITSHCNILQKSRLNILVKIPCSKMKCYPGYLRQYWLIRWQWCPKMLNVCPLSLHRSHIWPQIHKILPFLNIVFEVMSKENTIQNELNQPEASCINVTSCILPTMLRPCLKN